MAKDNRDLLEVLRFELNFIEQGGYGRSVRTPWKPTSIFQDSLSCLNFSDPQRSEPCEACVLMSLVPAECRNETVPCHHIALNDAGQSLDELNRGYNQQELEEAVVAWLRKTIDKLERERARQRAAG